MTRIFSDRGIRKCKFQPKIGKEEHLSVCGDARCHQDTTWQYSGNHEVPEIKPRHCAIQIPAALCVVSLKLGETFLIL